MIRAYRQQTRMQVTGACAQWLECHVLAVMWCGWVGCVREPRKKIRLLYEL
jgi:hypothetical protein